MSGGPISTAGSNALTLTGSDFTSASAVFIGSTPAASFSVGGGGTSITLVTPALPAGVYDVTVTTPSGTSATCSGDQVTCVATALPTVTSISYSGTPTTAGGSAVTISGTYFTGAVSVTFGDIPATFTVTNDNTIAATAPPQWAGTVDIRVTTYAGTSAPNAADRFTYAVNGTPAVTSLDTSSGTTAGGTSVTVYGNYFTDAVNVMFGSTPASSFTVNSGTSITAVAPPQVAGTVDVIVSTNSGTSQTSSNDQFTYSAAAAPVVSSVSPGTGSTAGNTQVTITGTGFTGAIGVVFGSVAATDFSVDSTGTQITVTAPAQAAAGNLDVRITTYAGTSPVTSNDQFTYTAASVPAVTGFDVNSSPTAGGVVVTVLGTNFTGATEVTFDGSAASFSVVSDTAILAVAPAHAATSGVYVQVTTFAGTSPMGSASSFAYSDAPVVPPTVSGLSTSSGTTAGGTVVMITGSHLGDVTGLFFGGRPAAVFVVNSGEQITAVTPADIAGQDDISMTIPGQSTPLNVGQFTFVAASAPAVTGVSYAEPATPASSAPVTITGTDFTGTSTVSFDGISTSFTVYSATTIVAISPPHAAGTIDITVTTPTGTSAITSYDQFTYSNGSAPSISSISPGSAGTGGGDVVSILGSNLSDATAVTFNTTNAAFSVVSDSLIFATVPAHTAGTGIAVTVTNETGISSAASFTYTAAAGPSVSNIAPANGPSTGGTLVTIVGSGFTGATRSNSAASPRPTSRCFRTRPSWPWLRRRIRSRHRTSPSSPRAARRPLPPATSTRITRHRARHWLVSQSIGLRPDGHVHGHSEHQ